MCCRKTRPHAEKRRTRAKTPGTIDTDYRGEIKVALINLGSGPYTFHRGDRIAQMVIKKVYFARLDIVTELDETRRNTGGFGHTGK
jgi:dUTP pyrophosphatase